MLVQQSGRPHFEGGRGFLPDRLEPFSIWYVHKGLQLGRFRCAVMGGLREWFKVQVNSKTLQCKVYCCYISHSEAGNMTSFNIDSDVMAMVTYSAFLPPHLLNPRFATQMLVTL